MNVPGQKERNQDLSRATQRDETSSSLKSTKTNQVSSITNYVKIQALNKIKEGGEHLSPNNIGDPGNPSLKIAG